MTRWIAMRTPLRYAEGARAGRMRTAVALGVGCALGGMVEMIQYGSPVGTALMALLAYAQLTSLDILRMRKGLAGERLVRSMNRNRDQAAARFEANGHITLLEVIWIEEGRAEQTPA